MGAFKRQMGNDFAACLEDIDSKVKGGLIPDCKDYMLLLSKFIGVSKTHDWDEVENIIRKVVND